MSKTVSLAECPPGMFHAAGGGLGFKTEYRDRGRIEAYVVRTGEFFWGGTTRAEDQCQVAVTPVEWSELILLGHAAPDPVSDFLLDVADEIERAAMLHPGPTPNLAALTEEVGELAKALLEAREYADNLIPPPWGGIREEAVQVAAMAFRIVFEGDPTMSVVPEVEG